MPRARLLACLALAACSGDPTTTTAADETSTGAADTTSDTGPTTTAASTSADASDTTETTHDASSTTAAEVPPLGPWRVMSFNVMCSSCRPEGFEDWEQRVPHIGDTIRRHDPDLLGTQELFTGDEVALIGEEAPGYTTIWFAKPDEASLDYADAVIFYRTDMFEEVEHGFYWLSPSPDKPYSTGFSTPQLARLVVWARLRALAEDAEFVFATTHFDNNSPSQELSAPLVLERTAAFAADVPVIMVGDFNSRPDAEAYTLLTSAFTDTFEIAETWRSDTNLSPAPAYDPSLRIDHIFVAGAPWQTSEWIVDQWGYGPNNHETSDHFAIAAHISVP